MSPYEALYGRDCRTPLNWSEDGERILYGNKKANEAKEKVKQVNIALEAAQDRYKAYADDHKRNVEYKIGEYVYLKVTPSRAPKGFKRKENLLQGILVHFGYMIREGRLLMR